MCNDGVVLFLFQDRFQILLSILSSDVETSQFCKVFLILKYM